MPRLSILRSPILAITVVAVLLVAVNEVLILDVAASARGEPSVLSSVLRRARGSSASASDVTSFILRTGVPDRYGAELGVTFPHPADQPAMEAAMAKIKQFDPAYGSAKIALDGALKQRYIAIGTRISCEFCCGAKAILFENGEAACGCAHSQAMRGLMAYLLQNHASEYTDDEILRELAIWKGLFFPTQMMAKTQQQLASGQYTPDIAALLLGLSDDDRKRLGATAASAPPSATQLPQMSGGC